MAEEESGEKKKVLPRWLPMESNPALLNSFLKRMKVSNLEFHDVFGLDEELLMMVPQPSLALCLLFPSKDINPIRREQFKDKLFEKPEEKGVFYLKQLEQFGNACGTIAMVHCIGNIPLASFDGESPLHSFIEENKGLEAQTLGENLAAAEAIHEASEQSASSSEAQTVTPDRNESVEGHFIAFVPINGHLFELDGMMGGPIDHGPVKPEEFLSKAASIVREQFMALAPGNLNFNVTSLGLSN